MISDKLHEFISPQHIKLKHRVNRLIHKDRRIERIIVNNGAGQDDIEIPVSTVINTLPLTLSMRMLEPSPPPDLCAIADAIKYRHLVLCVFCLNRDAFSSNASIYFPSEEFPFTRLYEPKNRSPHMAPEGQTVIVLEIPCDTDDVVWNMKESELRTEVWNALQRVKPILQVEILHFQTYQMPFAYPILEVGFEENIAHLVAYFETFENLYLTGRSSLFRYLHLHDLFKVGEGSGRTDSKQLKVSDRCSDICPSTVGFLCF